MRKKQSIIGLAVIFLICIIVEVISNLPVFMLEDGKKGLINLDNLVKSEGFVDASSEYKLVEEEGFLRWELNGDYVDKFCYDFSCKDLLNANIRVGVINGFGKEEVVEIYDTNPKLITKSVVNIKKNVNWIELAVESGTEHSSGDNEVVISNIQIKNQILINPYRICVVFLLGLMIFLLWFYRKLVLDKVEYGFLIISLALGLVMLISFPANKVGWDEESHFNWVYRLSLFPGGEMMSTETSGQLAVTTYNWPHNQLASYEEKIEMRDQQNYYYSDGDHAVVVEGQLCGLSTPGLIFQALVVKLARNLGFSFSNIYLLGRLAGLLLYSCLLFFAIKIIPIAKRTLLFISLMPTSVFLSVCYTYDISVYGFIMLGIAILLREWLSDKQTVCEKNCVIAMGCLVWGILPKAIYAPLLLLGEFIPLEKYKNKKRGYIFRGIFIFLFILLMFSFILPQLFNPEVKADYRGGDVNPGEQMSLIFNNLITYIYVLFGNIFASLPSYAFGEASYRLMGHLPIAGFAYLVPVVIVFLILTDKDDKMLEKKILVKQRILIFIILGLSVALIWTALYLAYTIPGSTVISGVQGRYYRPLLLLLYIILGNNFISVNAKRQKYNFIIYLLIIIILGVTSIQVFAEFCL